MYMFYLKCIYTSFIIGSIDLAIQKLNYNARWFQLHAIINYIIAALTYRDTLACFYDPTISSLENTPGYAASMCFVLHLYHCFMFKMRLDDWLHHFSGFCVTPILVSYSCKGMAPAYFFISGLPGALDYSMLTLYKNSLVTKNTQKYFCSKINAYLRMPGGIISAYLLLKDSFTQYVPNNYLLFLSFFLYVNSVYYGKQAIENYGAFKCITI